MIVFLLRLPPPPYRFMAYYDERANEQSDSAFVLAAVRQYIRQIRLARGPWAVSVGNRENDRNESRRPTRPPDKVP